MFSCWNRNFPSRGFDVAPIQNLRVQNHVCRPSSSIPLFNIGKDKTAACREKNKNSKQTKNFQSRWTNFFYFPDTNSKYSIINAPLLYKYVVRVRLSFVCVVTPVRIQVFFGRFVFIFCLCRGWAVQKLCITPSMNIK